MRRHRILRIVTRLNVGGPSFQAILLSRELEKRGFDTLLAAGDPGRREGNLRSHAAAAGVRIESIPGLVRGASPIRDAAAFLRIAGLIRRWRPDLIHTHMAKAGLIGRVSGWALGVPVRVHTFHGHVFTGYFSPWLSDLAVRAERALARITDRLVAVGPTVREEICSTYRIAAPEKVEVIRLGVPSPARPGGRIGAPVVGFAGRLAAVKDPLLFLRVVSDIRRVIPTLQIRMAGDGPLREEVRRFARKSGTYGALDLLGWLADMKEFYSGIDVLLLTSRAEGTPRSVIEAQAAGIPVVALDVGAVRDLFTIRRQDGPMITCDEGILIGGRDPGPLANAVAGLLGDPARRRRMGKAGRERVARVHSEERLIAETDRLYRGLLREKGIV